MRTQRLLSGLRSRLLTCEAEHFGIDGRTELSPAAPEGQLHQVRGPLPCSALLALNVEMTCSEGAYANTYLSLV